MPAFPPLSDSALVHGQPGRARRRWVGVLGLVAAVVSGLACAVCFSGLWPAVQVGQGLPPWQRWAGFALVLLGPLGLAGFAALHGWRDVAPAAEEQPAGVKHDSERRTGVAAAAPADGDGGHLQETIVQLRELLVLAEGEKWHFGQAIHDELGQRLSGMAYFAKALQRKLQKAQRAESADAGWLTDLANESMAVARGLARGLLPVGTDDPGGLGAALAELCERAGKTFGIACTLHVDDAFDAGGAAQASHLYHAIQELVTNAVKHGKSRAVHVSLDTGPDRQRATVRNDGLPLADAPERLGLGSGMGLRGVRSRAAYLGAPFTLVNEPQGTVLATIELPLAGRLRDQPP